MLRKGIEISRRGTETRRKKNGRIKDTELRRWVQIKRGYLVAYYPCLSACIPGPILCSPASLWLLVLLIVSQKLRQKPDADAGRSLGRVWPVLLGPGRRCNVEVHPGVFL